MKQMIIMLCTSLLLSSCATAQRREMGTASLHNVALTNDQVAQCAAVLSRLSRGAPVAAFYEKVPQLKRQAQEVIYPFLHGRHDPGPNVLFFGYDKATVEAWERAQREKRLRSEWDATIKSHPFLSQVAFTPSLRVGKFTLNPTHALYLVTEDAAPGDRQFTAAFVREERTD